MWSFFANLFAGGVTGILGGVRDTARVFTVDRTEQEQHRADQQMAAQAELAAEFAGRPPKTKWDSFVDGLNRLPRPLMALSVIGVFVLPAYDPLLFAQIMAGYAATPSWLAAVWAQVILLYFGGRMLENWNGRTDPPSAEQLRAMMDGIRNIGEMRREQRAYEDDLSQAVAIQAADPGVPPEQTRAEAVVDRGRPINAVVDAWRTNRRVNN